MNAIVYAALIAANSAFWFALALSTAKTDGKPLWLAFLILAMVTVPAGVGVALGWALKEKR